MDGRALRARKRLKRSDTSFDAGDGDIDIDTKDVGEDLKVVCKDARACGMAKFNIVSEENNELVFTSCDRPYSETKVDAIEKHDSGFLVVNDKLRRKGIVGIDDDIVEKTKRLSLTTQKQNKFSQIKHKFKNVHEVREEMKAAGLGECNMIVAIDYTPSNLINGQRTFGGRSLHELSPNVVNPYKEVICIFGETLEDLKTENAEIPVFGFGNKLFPMQPQKKCFDFCDVISLYEMYTPNVKLSGPTDFSLIIYESIKIVERTKKFHILLIIADGQVTDEQKTIEALIDASNYALSVVVVGVGDGPWDAMNDFHDNLPDRKFDNFQFVDFHGIKEIARNPEAEFALMALMEVPQQFKAMCAMNLFD